MRTHHVVFRVAKDGEPDALHAVFQPEKDAPYSKHPLTVWTPGEGYGVADWGWYRDRTRPAMIGEFEKALEKLRANLGPDEAVEVRRKIR